MKRVAPPQASVGAIASCMAAFWCRMGHLPSTIRTPSSSNAALMRGCHFCIAQLRSSSVFMSSRSCMRSGSLCEPTGSCCAQCAAPGSLLQVPLREPLLAQSTATRGKNVAHGGSKSHADKQVRARRGGPARCAGRTLPSCTGFALTSTLGLPHFWHTWVLSVLPLPQNEQGQPLGMLTGSTTRRGCRHSAMSRCDSENRDMDGLCAPAYAALAL